MEKNEIKKWLDKYNKVKADKTRWNELWQYCGEYIHIRKQNFTQFRDQGTFLNRDVFDSTGPKANRKMAASLIGLLWQSGGKSIRLDPVRKLSKSAEVKDYFEWMTEEVADALDDPKAGLALALEEYMIDQGCFGTSGVGAFDGVDADLLFKAWGVDEIAIEEGSNGYVRTIYREFEISIMQAVEDYGLENLSEKTQKLFKDGNSKDKVTMLHIIAPRQVKKVEAGNRAMDFLSVVIEKEALHGVEESGFEEMPVAISRFFKRKGEVYGRSPAMDALPDILEINAVKEARIVAIEKSLDPPLGVHHDSMLGNEEIDTSPRAINVFQTSSKLGNRQPVFPLFTVETIREADKSIEELKQSINEHFNIDRLLDFNNQTQMTLGEAQLRNRIRSESLGSLFNRQINEGFTPLIERSVALLFRKGKLGVIKGSTQESAMLANGQQPRYIPNEVAQLIVKGEDFYEVTYLTPAARMMETEEAEGVMRTWEFGSQLAGLKPEVLDILDAEEGLRIVGRNFGSPTSAFVSEEVVEQIRAKRAELQAAQAKLETIQQGGEAVGSVADSAKKLAETQNIAQG